MDLLKQAREMFANDHFAANTGIVIDSIHDCEAICHMEITDGHKNAAGVVMGGALMTLADFAFAVAANVKCPLTVSVTCSTSFLKPCSSGVLTASARPTRIGNCIVHYCVEIKDDRGEMIATSVITGFRKEA